MKKTTPIRTLDCTSATAEDTGALAARIDGLEKALADARSRLADEVEKRRSLESVITTARQEADALRRTVHYSPAVIFTWEAREGLPVVFAADNVRRFGYTPEDFYSGRLQYADIIQAEDRQTVIRAMLGYGQSPNDENLILTYRLVTAEGREAWIDHHTWVIPATDGQNIQLEGALLDITDRKTAELALRESESKFRSLTEESLVGVYIIQQGKFKYVNPEFARILGYQPKDIIDKIGPNELALPEDRSLVAQNIHKRIDGHIDSLHYEFRGLARNNRVVNLEVFGSRIQLNGEPAVIGSLLDITDRKQAERELRLTQYAVDQSATAIFRIDPSARITYANHAASRLLGYSEQELEGMTIPDIDPQWTQEFWELRGLPMLRKNRVNQFETEHIRRDGSRYPVEVICYLAEFEEAEQYYAFFSDISVRKRAEAEIQRHREHLEDLVQERTMELTAAKEQAEVANRAKSEFLANMSHEIRTPLNGVIGMIELLKDTDLTPEQLDFAATAASSANALLNVINDILDFSKIEAGKLDFEYIDFDLRELMEDLAEMLNFQAREKNLEVTCFLDPQAPSLLRGDPWRLHQVLLNLATNALKFTQAGEVNIRATAKAHSSTQVEFCFAVTDSGIGVPESLSHRLFKPFSQLDSSTTRKFGGTGLGLAICKKLVDMMDGQIGVSSKPGHGSKFWFTVQLDIQAPSSHKANLCQPADGLKDIRILTADNKAANREILNAYLLSSGCEVRLAADHLEALESMSRAAAEGKPFDLVIIDSALPAMDGKALGRAIRDQEQLRDTPMMMLTPWGSGNKYWDAARKIGINGFLTKPIRLSNLRNALWSVLHGQPCKTGEDPEYKPAAAHTVDAAAATHGTILLAEDNTINQKLALYVLKKLGHQADAVANGRLAIEALARREYDLILMDVQMPEMDGLVATQLIRAQEPGAGNRIPIIAMTAHAMTGDREKCLEAGMDDYISKPVDPDELASKLRHWLKKISH